MKRDFEPEKDSRPLFRAISQGIDPCTEINRRCHIRICKAKGHFQFHEDGRFAHGFFDRDTTAYPIPDHGKFGFR